MEYLLIPIVTIILSSLFIKLLQVQAAGANPHGVQNSARNLVLVIDALRQRAIQFFVAARLLSELKFYYWILSALWRVVKYVSTFLNYLISLVLRSNQADLERDGSFTPMSPIAENADSDSNDADVGPGGPSSPTVSNNSHDTEDHVYGRLGIITSRCTLPVPPNEPRHSVSHNRAAAAFPAPTGPNIPPKATSSRPDLASHG